MTKIKWKLNIYTANPIVLKHLEGKNVQVISWCIGLIYDSDSVK